MALPNSGQLSFSAIADILSLPISNVSLRNMSNQAGFSSPDSVSEFYGYSPGGGPKLLLLSYSGKEELVCSEKQIEVYSDNEDFTKATFLYSDSGGTTPAEAGYYTEGALIRLWLGEEFDTIYEGFCKL